MSFHKYLNVMTFKMIVSIPNFRFVSCLHIENSTRTLPLNIWGNLNFIESGNIANYTFSKASLPFSVGYLQDMYTTVALLSVEAETRWDVGTLCTFKGLFF